MVKYYGDVGMSSVFIYLDDFWGYLFSFDYFFN